MATFRGSGSTQNGAVFPTEAELEAAVAAAAASQTAALASENAAAASEAAADADATATAADLVLTDADQQSCDADATATAADVVSTNADVVTTNADAATTTQDAIDTAADAIATAADAVATAADLVLTDADQVSCAADAATTAQDAIDTAADAVSTAADVVTTTQDAIDTAADAVATAADVVSAEAAWDTFDDIFLGSKASDPTLDNDGDALATGALYWNNVSDNMRVYTGSVWDVWDYIKFTGGTMTGDLVAHSITFTENTITSPGATETIDWTADGSKQRIDLDASITISFTDPPGPTNLMLMIRQGASAAYTVTWPAIVDWPQGQAPVFDTGTYDYHIVSLYFDGDRYYGAFGYNYY